MDNLQAAQREGLYYVYQAEVERVMDGDSCVLHVDLGLRAHVQAFIRLAHVNAPELRHENGTRARDRFQELLSVGPLIIQTTKDKQEKYGRWLARIVNADGVDVGQQMVEEGLAWPYEGGRR